MAKATLLLHRKLRFEDGAIVELKVWKVPAPVRGSAHAFKYSLFYGRAGARLVGYDNESGKGDHRHHGDREEAYRFTTIDRLLEDFASDVERMRGEGP